MPFKRKSNKSWPPCVYENNGSVIYRPRIPQKLRDMINTTKAGFLSPPVVLGRATDPVPTIMRRYLEAAESIASAGERDRGTVQWLADKYFASREFTRLRQTTQQDYLVKLCKFLVFPTKIKGASNKPLLVGEWPLESITQPKLRNLPDEMLSDYEAKGMSGRSTVNGQFRVFSTVIKYGLQHFETLGLPSNPCIGVRLHKENQRNRYVTDHEFELQWNVALRDGADYLPWLFELAYLLASRSVEIGDLLKTSATDGGIIVERRKGSKTNIISWSPRLKIAYECALELSEKRDKKSPYLLTSANGEKLCHSTLQSAMARLKKKMTAAGLGETFWTLHDLKRKGISDSKDKNIGGHKTVEMQQRYNTKIEVFEPPSY